MGLKFVSPFVSHPQNSPVKYGGERGIRTPDTTPRLKSALLLVNQHQKTCSTLANVATIVATRIIRKAHHGISPQKRPLAVLVRLLRAAGRSPHATQHRHRR